MTDRRLDLIVSKVLRTGVFLAFTIVAIGGVLYLIQHGSEVETFSTFRSGGADFRLFAQSEGLIQFGLLVLIATPIVRVALAAVGFALERDGLYTAVSLIVLAILTVSIFYSALNNT